jgi:hypothetical protein
MVAPHHYEGLIGVVCDAGGKVYSVRSNLEVSVVPNLDIKARAITELKYSPATVVADDQNRLLLINWDNCRFTSSSFRFETPVVSMVSHDRNMMFTLCESGQFRYFDKRTDSIVASCDFSLTGMSLAAWLNCALVAVGFAEGVIVLVDTRMMLPQRMIYSDSPLQMTAVHRNVCNLMVAGRERVQCFDGYIGTVEMEMAVRNPVLCDYDGGAVVAVADDAFWLDCEHFENSLSLGESRTVRRLEVTGAAPSRITGGGKTVVHCHGGAVECMCHSKEVFLSGDGNGFLHAWTLSGNWGK